MDRLKSQGRGWWCPLSLGPWDLGRWRRKMRRRRRSGNEQAKRKNGHGSNERVM